MVNTFLFLFLFASLNAVAQHKVAVSDVTNIKIRVPQITKTDAAYAEVNKDST
ncbi:MAG: hypothetical protein H7296_02895 [Bacteroidia bacterium]|nr:hypothetical protein [Bacteroidia bacterium]